MRVPQPPTTQDPEKPRSGSAKTRHLRRSRSTVEQPGVDSSEEDLPLPKEETSLPALPHVSSYPTMTSQSNEVSLGSVSAAYHPDPHPNTYSSLGGGINWEAKYRQDILAGLQYFESNNAELKDLNNRLVQELDRVNAANEDLENRLRRSQQENQQLRDDLEESKIKLDQQGKENMRLEDQAHSQWRSRIKLEEMYCEFRKESEAELKQLRESLHMARKNLQQVPTPSPQPNQKVKFGDSTSGSGSRLDDVSVSKKDPHVRQGLADDNLELLHKLRQLEEDLSRLNRDKDSAVDNNGRLKQEIADLKSALKVKSHELDGQYKRFLSLKKSFNDLADENEKLKIQLRGRGKGSIANSTWPSVSSSANKVETVHVIDLPSGFKPGSTGNAFKTSAAPAHLQAGKSQRLGPPSVTKSKGSLGGHRSGQSDSTILVDNLPPVSNHAH